METQGGGICLHCRCIWNKVMWTLKLLKQSNHMVQQQHRVTCSQKIGGYTATFQVVSSPLSLSSPSPPPPPPLASHLFLILSVSSKPSFLPLYSLHLFLLSFCLLSNLLLLSLKTNQKRNEDVPKSALLNLSNPSWWHKSLIFIKQTVQLLT